MNLNVACLDCAHLIELLCIGHCLNILLLSALGLIRVCLSARVSLVNCSSHCACFKRPSENVSLRVAVACSHVLRQGARFCKDAVFSC